MLLAYVDESGDNGPHQNGGSATYSLGCVLLDAEQWPEAFNGLINFRRRLRQGFGIGARVELKANYLVNGRGTIRDLNLAPAQRQRIYRDHLKQIPVNGFRAFGVVVDKTSDRLRQPPDVLAWETLMERLERTSNHERTAFALFHDNGSNDMIRKVARKARRRITAGSAFGTGQIVLAANRFIDDPTPRDSAQSYMIQMADLVAYAAVRTVIPPGRAIRLVVPSNMWNEIGEGVHRPVNSVRGGTPGIVVRKY